MIILFISKLTTEVVTKEKENKIDDLVYSYSKASVYHVLQGTTGEILQ